MSAASYPLCAPSDPRRGLRLLAQARRGNGQAFAEMVAPYVPILHRRARGVTGNVADAEDVRQETLLKAWMRLEQFTGKQSESGDDFRAWLARIGANTSIDLLRQRRDGKMSSLEEPKGPNDETLGGSLATEQPDPEERCARREMGRLLASAIVQLPPDLRQACLLRDVLHYSTQEVADRLNISIVAVRLRLFRARRRLREKLQDSLRPKMRAGECAPRREPSFHKPKVRPRPRYLSLGAAPEYVSGD